MRMQKQYYYMRISSELISTAYNGLDWKIEVFSPPVSSPLPITIRFLKKA